ncbi:MAG: TraR/DksA C4-type zinc finger protein, partial [Telluria sp.]|nr:TraR/DksA C4-type zinc finger protein [Telluria sp.]
MSLSPALVAELEERLRQSRTDVLRAIRNRLHQGDDPAVRTLVNNLETAQDLAAADLLNDTEIALLGNELVALREIDAALKRLGQGLAGVCSRCGEPIAEARLRANPAADTCLGCQQQIEHRQPLGHGPPTL